MANSGESLVGTCMAETSEGAAICRRLLLKIGRGAEVADKRTTGIWLDSFAYSPGALFGWRVGGCASNRGVVTGGTTVGIHGMKVCSP